MRVDLEVGHGREHRLQCGQAFGRGAGSGKFLLVQRQRAVFAVHRHQALLEMSARDRRGRLALAVQRQRIDIGARDALHAGDRVGTHTLLRLRVPGAQAQVAAVHHRRPVAAAVARHRHHLGAAGHHQLFHARHHLRRGKGHRGDARAAVAVQRHARRADVVAGVQRRHAAQVTGLRADLCAGAPDDVGDIFGAQAVALGNRLQHGGRQVLRVQAGQRALAGLADAAWGAAGVDDQCVHRASPWCRCRMIRRQPGRRCHTDDTRTRMRARRSARGPLRHRPRRGRGLDWAPGPQASGASAFGQESQNGCGYAAQRADQNRECVAEHFPAKPAYGRTRCRHRWQAGAHDIVLD